MPFTALASRELGVDGVGDLQAPVGQAVGLGQFDVVAAIDTDHAREIRLRRDAIDFGFQRLHRWQRYSPMRSSSPQAASRVSCCMVPGVNHANQVWSPTMPSTATPLTAWRSRSEASVIGPKMPSIGPA